ncbi:ERVV2 protein, partial [Melanocharis versteri]|nr:ERVV2 protein [Melanocharis versteri]
KLGNSISVLQQEFTNLSKVIKQNGMALDLLLASRRGVCTVINSSCCVYIDQALKIQNDQK